MPAHNWPLPKCGCRRRKPEAFESLGGSLRGCSGREVLRRASVLTKSKEEKGQTEKQVEDTGKEEEAKRKERAQKRKEKNEKKAKPINK